MQTIHQLYLQNPLWVWLAVGAVFLATDMALGVGFLIWPGLAATLVGLLNLVGVHLGLGLEVVVFAVLSGIGLRLSQTGGLKFEASVRPKAVARATTGRTAGAASAPVVEGDGTRVRAAMNADAAQRKDAWEGVSGDAAPVRDRVDHARIPLPVRPAHRTAAAKAGASASAPGAASQRSPADGRKPLTFRPPDPNITPRRAQPLYVETRAPAMAMQLAGQSVGDGRDGLRRVVVASSSAARLIGRIGRTTAAFVDGSGVIWIDGGEWRADVDEGMDSLPKDAPVRVLGVGADGRLQVRGLGV